MSSSRRTTVIERPVTTAAPRATPRTAQVRKPLGDLTTSVPRDKRLLPGPVRPIAWLAGTVVVAAVVAALFVIPVRNWFAQDDSLAEREAELDVLQQANAELEAANARLQTPDGIREAAREEIGYVSPGEERQTVMPVPAAPLTLPSGWPYDVVGQIVGVRNAPPPAPAPAPAPAP